MPASSQLWKGRPLLTSVRPYLMALAQIFGLWSFSPHLEGQVKPPGLSSRGTGLISLPDTRTRPPGEVALGIGIDNRDRDPLGVDILDGTVFWTLGIAADLEIYGSYLFSRVVATPHSGMRRQPRPPLDLILPPNAAVPSRPYYSLQPEVPYLDTRTSARFSDYLAGDVLFGAKLRLRNADRKIPAVAIGGDMSLPLSRDPMNLASGSGSGGLRATGRGIFEWPVNTMAFVFETGYTWTGHGHQPDRLLRVVGSGIDLTEEPLRLPDLLRIGFGIRWQFRPAVAAVGELSTDRYVGTHTEVLDLSPPVDLIAGVQLTMARTSITAGIRYNASAPRSGEIRTSPLGGSIVLSDVDVDTAAEYLESLNLGQTVPLLRGNSQKLLRAPVSGSLPEGVWIVPAEYSVRSEHQIGFLLFVGWRFNAW
jgi:hypothetical protein